MNESVDNQAPYQSLMRRLWPKHLAAQFMLVFTALLLISMVAYSYRALKEEIFHITETMRTQSQALADNLAATGGSLILDKDYTAIEQMLLRTSEFPGISSLQIMNQSGKIYGNITVDSIDGPQVVYDVARLKPPEEIKTSFDINDDEMVAWQPIILGDHIGWVKITYHLDAIKQAEQRIWKNNALVGFVILLLAIGLIILVLRRPLASIERYTEFAGKLVDGKGMRVKVSTQSEELMLLGDALNTASYRLHIQDNEIRQALTELERLAAFPEQNPNIVLSLNPDGELQYLNPFGKSLLNQYRVDLTEFAQILPENYQKIVKDCLKNQITTRYIENKFRDCILLWTFAPVKNQKIVHGYAHEITEKRLAEQRANKAQIEMRAITAANKAKSAFLANMSHEMRTPLTAIIGFAESLLEQGQTMEERIANINTIIRTGKHLLQLINEILDLSKIEAEKLAIENIQVDLFELVSEVRSIGELHAQKKQLNFFISFHYPLPRYVITDPVRLKEILLNLTSNAIKFTETGQVTIDIRFDKENNLLVFSVKDTGIGMTEEQIEKLFQPFTQADDSTTRKFGGTGLGLYLSKLLTEKLGGSMNVSSKHGEGSRFHFTVAAGDTAVNTLLASEPDNKHDNLKLQPLAEQQYYGSILLVEDNPDNQRLISFYLKKLGATVSVAENGRIGVEQALSDTFDLILMDMQMPEMDGLQATRLLRENNYTGPIYALTANMMPSEIEACIVAGCNGLLGKPIERDKFTQVVLSYLHKKTATTPVRHPPIISELIESQPELSDLIESFIKKLPALVDKIDQIWRDKDWPTLKIKIHDLKGVSGTYGFPQISKLAEQIEFEIAKESYASIEPLLITLKSLQEAIYTGFYEKTGT